MVCVFESDYNLIEDNLPSVDLTLIIDDQNYLVLVVEVLVVVLEGMSEVD